MNKKKVLIVRAGPAGLAAAYKLAGKADITVIDQGKSAVQRKCPSPKECIECPVCDNLKGVGGAGTFSDGKLIFETLIGKSSCTPNSL